MKILVYPDPKLRVVCKPIENVTDDLRATAKQMLNLMYKAEGIGLAAPQVGLDIQLVVADITRGNSPLILFNPKMIERNGNVRSSEGCLSFPGEYVIVSHPERIFVSYLTVNNKQEVIEVTDLLAQVLHHEILHLTGNLFIDRMNIKDRTKIKTKFLKRNNNV